MSYTDDIGPEQEKDVDLDAIEEAFMPDDVAEEEEDEYEDKMDEEEDDAEEEY